MKKYILLLALAGLMLTGAAKPANLRAYLAYSAFYSPEDGPYLETYLSVLGESVVFVKQDNGKYRGTLQITMLFKQNDSIREFRKYELLSPEIDDTASINLSFLDQQRIPLPNGSYELNLSIADKNRDRKPFQVSEDISINFPKDKICVSGIELVESYGKSPENSSLSKSGYDFIPYMDNFYPAAVNKLTYYAEIYHAASVLGSEDAYVVNVAIKSFETGKLVADFQKVRRESARPVSVAFGDFDISKLPSGNYNLVISVRDKNNQELAKNQVFFQRSNPNLQYDIAHLSSFDISNSFAAIYTNIDTLREHVRSLFPISSGDEKLFIRTYQNTNDIKVLQRFFHVFWISRDPANPVAAWNNYYEQVLAADRDFGTSIKKGYETDRGRVYLQYGPPNHRVEVQDDPGKRPYEIWQYYKAGIQSDRRFVFLARDRSTNDFELVHSDVNGEVYDPWWQDLAKIQEHGRDPNVNYLHRMDDGADSYFGGHSSDYYNNPR